MPCIYKEIVIKAPPSHVWAGVRELIVALDDERRRLAYAVIEGSKRTTYHHASMQVFADDEGGSRLVWITDFLLSQREEFHMY